MTNRQFYKYKDASLSGMPAADVTPLVSVVVPLFNAEKYIADTISSVLAQTYKNWELILIDDCSEDNSYEIAERFSNCDSRIHLIKKEFNSGAAESRNQGIQMARGRFIAFLDADDLWNKNKLQRQVEFMLEESCAMTFTSYETIESDGTHRNFVHVPVKIKYEEFLKNTITCSHTIMFDIERVPKEELLCPRFDSQFDFPEDLVVWLNVLKQIQYALGIDEILAKNRKHASSRSANKIKAIERTWNAYRKIEQLPFLFASYCLFWQLFNAVKKRVRN